MFWSDRLRIICDSPHPHTHLHFPVLLERLKLLHTSIDVGAGLAEEAGLVWRRWVGGRGGGRIDDLKRTPEKLQNEGVTIGLCKTTPYHSDDANDSNGISCITTPPLKNHKTSPPKRTPKHPFLGPPPPHPTYSLRSPNTTQLAPSTKAGFRNIGQIAN